MSSEAHQQQDADRRAFIIELMDKQLGRQVLQISSLGRNSNNYVYRVDLSVAIVTIDSGKSSLGVISQSTNTSTTGATTGCSSHNPRRRCRPGTVPLTSDVATVVVRISNPDALLNEEVRVQNEVAAIKLMRQALADGEWASLVPAVYAWYPSSPAPEKVGDGNKRRGWIVQEYKEGVQLDTVFDELDQARQREVVRQVVSFYKLIQDFELPSSVRGYGGLAFDYNEYEDDEEADNTIITGPTTIPCGGPYDSLPEMYAQMLRHQLEESDTLDRLDGWRQNGLRERLEAFAADGIVEQTRKCSITRRILVHGDINTFNMLYDAASNRITALLDFDFSHIASPADEYFYSFRAFGALIAPPFDDDPEEVLLRDCLLEGFDGKKTPPVPLQPSTGGGGGGTRSGVNWSVAVMMDEESRAAGLLRPADIPGSGELSALHWFLEDVAPPYFFMPRWVASRQPGEIERIHRSIAENLDRSLARWT